MDKRFLLTYTTEGTAEFAWFDDVEEMEEFIDEYPNIEILEKLEIYGCRSL